MATSYKRPGVYVEENLTPLTQDVEGSGDFVGAFVAPNSMGPTEPTLVESWSQYVSRFGDFGDGTYFLPFAVHQFFNNGGRQAFVARAAANDATAATITLNATDEASAEHPALTVTASSPGAWGNTVSVDIVQARVGRYDFVVRVGGELRERFPDVSSAAGDSRNVVSIVNSSVVGSRYVRVTVEDATQTPDAQELTPLTTGTDGTGDATSQILATAERFEDATDVPLTLNLPGINDSTTVNSVISWAEGTGRVMVVVDGVVGAAADLPTEIAAKNLALVTGGSAIQESSYVAIYGPWLWVDDPSVNVSGAMRLLPPGGAVLGQYARNDTVNGVQKAPAGVGTQLRGVLQAQAKFSHADLDLLNDAGVNVIRSIPGAGFCIMGARTLSKGLPDRYVSVRRTLMAVRKGLTDSTRFAIFEPNNSLLWEKISAVSSQYLTTLMQTGVLRGNTPDESYFVKCDAENNPSPENGIVNVEVGVAVSSPAEFIIIRIGQFDGGTNVDETVL